MNLKEEFPSKWFKGDDLEEPLIVTISEVGIEEFESRNAPGKKERKVSLKFEEEDKGVILNVGMRNIVSGFYGYDTDEWIGKRIKLIQSPFTSDKGETSMVVRIHPKMPVTTAKPATKQTAKPADQDGFDPDADPNF